ncbi:hypothetical protein B296_00037829 [Ensete ventricosum]|uniref:Uncharacterized protein n=1 Tax=Ensete ventricosum TaxID=4639 RepID=A0A426ZTH8_ENSVE|nr:hypothetical protein B296_00037829 [Ensete ventricosum]
MIDFDRRCPLSGDINRGRKKKRENLEIRCHSPSTILICRPWGEEALARLLGENNLQRSQGEETRARSLGDVVEALRGRFFSLHGEKKHLPSWGERTRRHRFALKFYESQATGTRIARYWVVCTGPPAIGMRTARYRAVLSIGAVSAPLPFEIDCWWSISGGISQAREKEEVGEEKLRVCRSVARGARAIRRSRAISSPYVGR